MHLTVVVLVGPPLLSQQALPIEAAQVAARQCMVGQLCPVHHCQSRPHLQMALSAFAMIRRSHELPSRLTP